MIIGIDEVGRGCWAGPLVAGAVALPESFAVPEADAGWTLNDSKQLRPAQRRAAAEALQELKVAYGLGWVSATELDRVGLTEAVRLAMHRAYMALDSGVRRTAQTVIIDGSINYLPQVVGSQAIVKADGAVPAVSAASILAKVARDNWMADAATRITGYGFEKHVGYGTLAHRQALAHLGICELHRRSFKPIADILANSSR